MENNQIVKNGSEAYGYNYASLSDIAKQGFKIPKMKVGVVNEKEYVFYFDEDLKEWIQGSQIVVPESPKSKDGKDKMNAAQLYGSALTYARRYTVQIALGLACDDDKSLESEPKEKDYTQPTTKKVDTGEMITDKQLELIRKQAPEVVTNIINHFKVSSLEQLTKLQASETIQKLQKKNAQKN